jgi:hypothetical protein
VRCCAALAPEGLEVGVSARLPPLLQAQRRSGGGMLAALPLLRLRRLLAATLLLLLLELLLRHAELRRHRLPPLRTIRQRAVSPSTCSCSLAGILWRRRRRRWLQRQRHLAGAALAATRCCCCLAPLAGRRARSATSSLRAVNGALVPC